MKKIIVILIITLGIIFFVSFPRGSKAACSGTCRLSGCNSGTEIQQGYCSGGGDSGKFCCIPVGGVTGGTASPGSSEIPIKQNPEPIPYEGTPQQQGMNNPEPGNPNAAPTPQQQSALQGGGMSQSTQQGTPTGGGNQSGFGNPITPTTIEGVLGSIMNYLRGIAGTIAVIFIIIGGVMYMLSGGNKEMTERAKKTVIFAMAGLAIVLAAPLFYQEIKAILGGGNPGSALQQILLNTLKLLLSIVGFLAIITMVVGSIWMFTAVGDEEKYELGKKTATYSILGLVIAVAALIIAQQVVNLIGSGSAPNSSYLPASSLPSGWNRGGQD